MQEVLSALTKAVGQLTDHAVLKVLAKTIAVTLVMLAGFGVATYQLLIWVGTTYAGASDGTLEALAAVVLAAIAAWFLFRLIAVAVLQFFADEIVAAVERVHYPEAAETAKPLPFRKDLMNSLRGAGRTLGVNVLALPVALVMLVTGIGPAVVFLAVNGWLLGRELTDMAWFRHCDGQMDANPVAQRERLMLGGAVAAMMMVPVLNLLAPVIGAAAGTHLTQAAMRKEKKLRQSELEGIS